MIKIFLYQFLIENSPIIIQYIFNLEVVNAAYQNKFRSVINRKGVFINNGTAKRRHFQADQYLHDEI